MTHVIALEDGQSGLGTSEHITPVLPSVNMGPPIYHRQCYVILYQNLTYMFPPIVISHKAPDIQLRFEFWIEQNSWIEELWICLCRDFNFVTSRTNVWICFEHVKASTQNINTLQPCFLYHSYIPHLVVISIGCVTCWSESARFESCAGSSIEDIIYTYQVVPNWFNKGLLVCKKFLWWHAAKRRLGICQQDNLIVSSLQVSVSRRYVHKSRLKEKLTLSPQSCYGFSALYIGHYQWKC